MERIYFISDVHLGGDPPEIESLKTNLLISFLNAIQSKADYLYIVGDLFEFWFEYRKAIPKINLKVISKLCQLHESGITIRYLTGNHDLWHETYFKEETDMEIYHKSLAVEHNSLKLHIAHGDGLAEKNWGLRLLNGIFKNRVNIFLFKLIHPDLGVPLAKWVSKKSREKGDNRFDEEYRKYALEKLNQGFEAVILGHTHKPIFENIGSKYYINLGDWIDSFTYLQLIGTKFELKKWGEKNDWKAQAETSEVVRSINSS